MKKEETKQQKDIYTLELTPFERFTIINMLPGQASLHMGILIDQLKNDLSLSDQEIAAYGIQFHQNGSVTFGTKKGDDRAMKQENAKPFEIGKEKFKIIKRSFKEADQNEQLPVNEYVHNLYYKVVNYEE